MLSYKVHKTTASAILPIVDAPVHQTSQQTSMESQLSQFNLVLVNYQAGGDALEASFPAGDWREAFALAQSKYPNHKIPHYSIEGSPTSYMNLCSSDLWDVQIDEMTGLCLDYFLMLSEGQSPADLQEDGFPFSRIDADGLVDDYGMFDGAYRITTPFDGAQGLMLSERISVRHSSDTEWIAYATLEDEQIESIGACPDEAIARVFLKIRHNDSILPTPFHLLMQEQKRKAKA